MGLDVLEVRLQDRDWLEGEVPTIADIACYPYAALADEAGVALGPYPAVRAWLERFAALPAYQSMPGLEVPGEALVGLKSDLQGLV